MEVALDYRVIDIHVHTVPWGTLNSEAAVMEAAQASHALLRELSTNPDKLVAYMDERNIEWLGLVNYLSPDTMYPSWSTPAHLCSGGLAIAMPIQWLSMT